MDGNRAEDTLDAVGLDEGDDRAGGERGAVIPIGIGLLLDVQDAQEFDETFNLIGRAAVDVGAVNRAACRMVTLGALRPLDAVGDDVRHGAGADGTNGFLPLIQQYALMFTRGRQKYHLLVPQEGLGSIYSDEFSEDMGDVIGSIPYVDHSRIYLTGTSMGGCGAVIECRRHPGRYAACVTSVAWLQNLENPGKDADAHEGPLDGEAFGAIAQTPMWLGYGRDERRVNEALYGALKKRGADVKRTYLKGFGHGFAGPVFWLTRGWAKWMFGRKL